MATTTTTASKPAAQPWPRAQPDDLSQREWEARKRARKQADKAATQRQEREQEAAQRIVVRELAQDDVVAKRFGERPDLVPLDFALLMAASMYSTSRFTASAEAAPTSKCPDGCSVANDGHSLEPLPSATELRTLESEWENAIENAFMPSDKVRERRWSAERTISASLRARLTNDKLETIDVFPAANAMPYERIWVALDPEARERRPGDEYLCGVLWASYKRPTEITGREFPSGTLVHEVHVHHFYVVRNFQRGGVGRRLFDAFMRAMPTPEGENRVVLATLRVYDRTPAADFYRRIGFRDFALDKSSSSVKDDQLANLQYVVWRSPQKGTKTTSGRVTHQRVPDASPVQPRAAPRRRGAGGGEDDDGGAGASDDDDEPYTEPTRRRVQRAVRAPSTTTTTTPSTTTAPSTTVATTTSRSERPKELYGIKKLPKESYDTFIRRVAIEIAKREQQVAPATPPRRGSSRPSTPASPARARPTPAPMPATPPPPATTARPLQRVRIPLLFDLPPGNADDDDDYDAVPPVRAPDSGTVLKPASVMGAP